MGNEHVPRLFVRCLGFCHLCECFHVRSYVRLLACLFTCLLVFFFLSDRERRVALVMAHFLRAAEFNMDFTREVSAPPEFECWTLPQGDGWQPPVPRGSGLMSGFAVRAVRVDATVLGFGIDGMTCLAARGCSLSVAVSFLVCRLLVVLQCMDILRVLARGLLCTTLDILPTESLALVRQSQLQHASAWISAFILNPKLTQEVSPSF